MGTNKLGLRGDQYVEVYVEVPKNLTAKQKDLLREFADGTVEHQPEQMNFRKKIEKFFNKN